MKIAVQFKNVYGEIKAYPVNTNAELFGRIAGTKTLTRATLASILALGLEIVELDRHGNVSRTFCGAASLSTMPVRA